MFTQKNNACIVNAKGIRVFSKRKLLLYGRINFLRRDAVAQLLLVSIVGHCYIPVHTGIYPLFIVTMKFTGVCLWRCSQDTMGGYNPCLYFGYIVFR